MLKRKAGLQKAVSKIFTGIQVPGRDTSETSKPPASQTPAPAKHEEPKPIPSASLPLTAEQSKKDTAPAPAPVPKVDKPAAPAPKFYEPPAAVSKVFESAAKRQESYIPPAPARSPAKHIKEETFPKHSKRIPGLKILEKLKNKLLAPKPGVKVKPGRQKAMIVVMPVLLIVFILVLMKSLRTPERNLVTGTKNSLSSVAFDGKIEWELPPIYPDNLRDPMVFGSVTQTKENSGKPIVKGIVFSEDNPCAVVGDRIVSVGDVVQEATVVKINSDSVEFAKGDETWVQKVER